MEHTKDYTLTVRQVLQNLGTLGDAYETVSRGGSPTGNYYFSVNAADAAATIKASQMLISQVPYWIPVGERLPEDNGPVLVAAHEFEFFLGEPFTDQAHWFDGEFWMGESPAAKYPFRITHWMPLPEPPG